MLDVERVDFVSVPTRDLARARAFYADVLGLPESDVTPDECERECHARPLAARGRRRAVRAQHGRDRPSRTDVEAARDHLSAHGVEFLGETVVPASATWLLYDTDGNVLILHRRYAPRA